MISSHRGLQFLVTVQKLELHVGLIEPLFCTLTLYDLKSGNRLSEVSSRACCAVGVALAQTCLLVRAQNFHFDLNDSSVLTGQMEVSKSLADKASCCAATLRILVV